MKRYIMVLISITLSLGTIACVEQVEEEKIIIEEPKEERKEGQKNLVKNEEIEEKIDELIKKIIIEEEYTEEYEIEKTEVWTYKEDEKKISDIYLSLNINSEDKEKVDKLIEDSAVLFEVEVSKKYEYEKLEINWETPDYKDDNIKEIIYYR